MNEKTIKIYETTMTILEKNVEIARLQNIIKEAIEYIENTYKDYKNEDGSLPLTLHDQELLEILDKVGSGKE